MVLDDEHFISGHVLLQVENYVGIVRIKDELLLGECCDANNAVVPVQEILRERAHILPAPVVHLLIEYVKYCDPIRIIGNDDLVLVALCAQRPLPA